MAVFDVALSSPQFEAIQAMRDSHVGDNPAGEPSFELFETHRDACSYHLAYLDNNEIAGSIRITPLGHGLTFAEKVVDVYQYFSEPLQAIDANRLIVEESFRGSGTLQKFLLETSDWLLTNTSFQSISALCLTPLAALYVNIGGRVMEKNINWKAHGRTRQYSLISLELKTVYNTINRRIGNGRVFQRAG